jgi:hypothetical protein
MVAACLHGAAAALTLTGSLCHCRAENHCHGCENREQQVLEGHDVLQSATNVYAGYSCHLAETASAKIMTGENW